LEAGALSGFGNQTAGCSDSVLAAVAGMAEELLKPGSWMERLVPALERLGRSVNAARLHVLRITSDDRGRPSLTCVGEWLCEGANIGRCTPGEVCAFEDLGLLRWYHALGSGAILHGPVADLPEPERTSIGCQGTVSIATVPIRVGEEFWGIIGIDDCERPRVWTSDEIESLATAARLIGNGIQRDRAEASIAEMSALERAVIDSSPIGISVRDRTGRLLRCNVAYQRIWAKTDEEILSDMTRVRAALELDVEHSYLGPYAADVLRVFTSGGVAHAPEVAVPEVRPGSAEWVSQYFVAIPDEHGEVQRVVVFTEDVSARRRAEEEARGLMLQLEAAARDLERRVEQRTAELTAANEELRAFAYSVSHDLSNPLRVIDGFCDALLDDYGSVLPEEARRYAERIRGSARHMGALIGRMLELSRMLRHELSRAPVSVHEVVEEVLSDLQSQVSAHPVSIEVGDLGTVYADRVLLRQVFQNLISNAVKFTRNRDDARIVIGREDGVFFVRDNGAGFPMEYAHKLFKPFQRLHSAQEFEGTGVGLAIVERIVTRHGGRVWAEGAENEGACFRFTIPDDTGDQENAKAP
jgi:signal transduction histidine kinase